MEACGEGQIDTGDLSCGVRVRDAREAGECGDACDGEREESTCSGEIEQRPDLPQHAVAAPDQAGDGADYEGCGEPEAPDLIAEDVPRRQQAGGEREDGHKPARQWVTEDGSLSKDEESYEQTGEERGQNIHIERLIVSGVDAKRARGVLVGHLKCEAVLCD